MRYNSVLKITTGDEDGLDTAKYEGIVELDGDCCLITYHELDVDNAELVPTDIVVRNGSTVTISRRGKRPMEMHITENTRHETPYATPYGNLTLCTHGKKVSFSADENGGRLEAVYAVYLNDVYSADRKVIIEFKLK